MWREWVAKSTTSKDDLHLVLSEDKGITGKTDDSNFDLTVYKHFLSRDWEHVLSMTFDDIAKAHDYCLKQYGVGPDAWKHDLTYPYTFEFSYTLSNHGVAQPHPIARPGAQILFRFSPIENDTEVVRAGLNICGNREGLKHLAALLLLCADSDRYDPEFHCHLEHQAGIEADCDVTLRAPIYLERLRSGKFSEYKGTPIRIDFGEDTDAEAS